MNHVTAVGYVASILSSIQLLPQFIQVCKNNSTQGLSIGMIYIVIVAQICWAYYGIKTKSAPLWLSCVPPFILSVWILKIHYSDNQNSTNTSNKTENENYSSCVIFLMTCFSTSCLCGFNNFMASLI
jgi:uncharacterized protein with PQ loop repeat